MERRHPRKSNLPLYRSKLQPHDGNGWKKITIAEVEELVPAGELDPDQIYTTWIFVQRIIQGSNYEKPIERRTTRPRE